MALKQEMIDIYNENMQKIGTELRETVHAQGLWHKTIQCWIVRHIGSGYVLFQRRGRNSDAFPNMLDCTAAGHYVSGETTEDGVREILEELNLEVDFKELVPLGMRIYLSHSKYSKNHEFADVFFLIRDEPLEKYNPNPKEVEGLYQIKIEDGLKLFSGEAEEIEAGGIEYDSSAEKWKPTRITVANDDFVPCIDPYYYKIFIMAQRYASGEKHISI